MPVPKKPKKSAPVPKKVKPTALPKRTKPKPKFKKLAHGSAGKTNPSITPQSTLNRRGIVKKSVPLVTARPGVDEFLALTGTGDGTTLRARLAFSIAELISAGGIELFNDLVDARLVPAGIGCCLEDLTYLPDSGHEHNIVLLVTADASAVINEIGSLTREEIADRARRQTSVAAPPAVPDSTKYDATRLVTDDLPPF
jgi:hypothetical protein